MLSKTLLNFVEYRKLDRIFINFYKMVRLKIFVKNVERDRKVEQIKRRK